MAPYDPVSEESIGTKSDALSVIPNILTALGYPPVSPPFRSAPNPGLPLLLWMQRLQRQTELEVVHLLRAMGTASVSVDSFYL